MWATVEKQGTITDILSKRYKYMEIVDLAVVEKVVYAVMRGIRDGQRRKSCFIFQLLDDNGKLAIGDYHESQNPSFDRCPKRLLEQLDETSISASNAWRTKCWANLEYAPKKLEHGSTVKFAQPIQFADGRVLDTFVYELEGRASYFVDGDTSYQIPAWRKKQYEVL